MKRAVAIGLGVVGLLAAGGFAARSRSEAAPSVAPKAVPPDPRGCLAATIHHEEHTDDRDGVSHDVRYDDRFVRCEGNVWTERVLPRGVPKDAAHGGHRHLPPAFTMARWVTRTSDGVAFMLVSRTEQMIVEMGRESYDAVRFDGDFDAAAHIVAPASIAAMTKLDRAAPAGAEWREKKTAAGTVRVLWSSTYDFPLEIETETADRRDRMVVTIDPLGELPWRTTDGYTKKEDSDFMD